MCTRRHKAASAWPLALLGRSAYRSGVPSLEHVAVELGLGAAGVVGHEGELGISGPGRGQGDPAQGVSHEQSLHTTHPHNTLSSNVGSKEGSPFRPRRRFLPL